MSPYNPNDPTPKWVQEVGGHECPKHGRYYGICHTCAAAQKVQDDFDFKRRLIDERDTLRSEVARLREALNGAVGYMLSWRPQDMWDELANDGDPDAQMLRTFQEALARTALGEDGKDG